MSATEAYVVDLGPTQYARLAAVSRLVVAPSAQSRRQTTMRGESPRRDEAVGRKFGGDIPKNQGKSPSFSLS
jgi:hypothetical protein